MGFERAEGPSRGEGTGPLPVGDPRAAAHEKACVFRESNGFEKQLMRLKRGKLTHAETAGKGRTELIRHRLKPMPPSL